MHFQFILINSRLATTNTREREKERERERERERGKLKLSSSAWHMICLRMRSTKPQGSLSGMISNIKMDQKVVLAFKE